MNFASVRARLASLPWRLPLSPHLRLGSRGERIAARYLRRKGHRVLARNYETPRGEIDLITLDGDQVVFVEVKTRRRDDLQDLLDTVMPAKWRSVERAARFYLGRHGDSHTVYRFDLVTVLWPAGWRPVVEHVENAFQPSD